MLPPNAKKLLLIAHNFPPLGSGGVHRPLKFARYLTALGWQVDVLSVKDIRYHAYDASLLEEIPEVRVFRAGSLEPLRLMWLAGWRPPSVPHSAVVSFADLQTRATAADAVPAAGRFYKKIAARLFQPDEQRLWVPFATALARKLIKKRGYGAILTTSPPESCHLVGLALRRYGTPWVADFRDAWTGHHLRADASVAAAARNKAWEDQVLLAADGVVANTDAMALDFRSRRPAGGVLTLPNGFDAADFGPPLAKAGAGDFVVVHNGSFRGGRRAVPLLEAFARARAEDAGFRDAASLYLIGINRSDDRGAAQGMGLTSSVFFVPYIKHGDAVRACQGADALALYMAAGEGDALIPGKLYEYLGVGKRIIAAVPPGQAAALLARTTRGAILAPPDDVGALAEGLKKAFNEPQAGITNYVTVASEVAAFSRPKQVETLAAFIKGFL